MAKLEKKLAESKAAAKEAGLSYVSDEKPGITRKHAGKSFHYFDAHGKQIHDADTLNRIRALAIPPAWKEVWISPSHTGHIQAVGRDDRGRKQYRYHNKWREARKNWAPMRCPAPRRQFWGCWRADYADIRSDHHKAATSCGGRPRPLVAAL